jgi:hypothetical protein
MLQAMLCLGQAPLPAVFFSPSSLILFAACRVGMMKTRSTTQIAYGLLSMGWVETMPPAQSLKGVYRRLSACP